jgi:hypothetical protein
MERGVEGEFLFWWSVTAILADTSLLFMKIENN